MMQIDRLVFPEHFKTNVPVARQIAEVMKEGILQGLVSPGIILPSVRDLAVQLKVSRSTAARAIEELAAQGYVVAEMGSGTRVAPRLPGQLAGGPGLGQASIADKDAPLKEVELSRFAQRLVEREKLGAISATVKYTGPSLKEMPLSIWRDLIVRHCRAGAEDLISYSPEPFGFPPLREAYASYLIRARAVKVTKERLITFASRNLRLDLLSRLLLQEGDLVAMEEPGFAAAREQLLAAGCRLIPIPVDSQGLKVDQLDALQEPVKLVYVTPSHQSPTGAVMSMIRRRQLLDYAARTGAYIVEDDYDSEFRYDGRPLPSLQGMDTNDRTIYLSCLWNVLAPLTRLGFMVLPSALVEALNAAKNLVERDVSYVEQAAMADFINEGHLEKLIRRQRTLYAARRQALLEGLERGFDNQIWTAPESAGLDLLVRFKDDFPDVDKVDRAILESGIPMAGTGMFYQGEARAHEYTIAFASLEEAEMASRLEKFIAALKG